MIPYDAGVASPSRGQGTVLGSAKVPKRVDGPSTQTKKNPREKNGQLQGDNNLSTKLEHQDKERAASFRKTYPDVEDVPDKLTRAEFKKLVRKIKAKTNNPDENGGSAWLRGMCPELSAQIPDGLSQATTTLMNRIFSLMKTQGKPVIPKRFFKKQPKELEEFLSILRSQIKNNEPKQKTQPPGKKRKKSTNGFGENGQTGAAPASAGRLQRPGDGSTSNQIGATSLLHGHTADDPIALD